MDPICWLFSCTSGSGCRQLIDLQPAARVIRCFVIEHHKEMMLISGHMCGRGRQGRFWARVATWCLGDFERFHNINREWVNKDRSFSPPLKLKDSQDLRNASQQQRIFPWEEYKYYSKGIQQSLLLEYSGMIMLYWTDKRKSSSSSRSFNSLNQFIFNLF